MGTTINPHSWGRRLAREAIRVGKRVNFGRKRIGSPDSVAQTHTTGMRKHYANMAKSLKKKG